MINLFISIIFIPPVSTIFNVKTNHHYQKTFLNKSNNPIMNLYVLKLYWKLTSSSQ